MRRGDLVTVVLAGDIGKPRPALIIQSDRFSTTTGVVVAPLSSTLAEADFARIPIDPSNSNGLRAPSQIMLDKLTTLKREKVGRIIGSADPETMDTVDRTLALFFGLA